MCLPAKLLHALVLLLVLTSLFVCSSIFVLTFRNKLLNLSFCKFLVLFHNCYYHYCQILNFDIHSPPCFKNNSMRIFKRSTPTIIILIDSFSGFVDTIVFFKKLKLKLTPFDIVHHSKGNPFQVHLTVSTE